MSNKRRQQPSRAPGQQTAGQLSARASASLTAALGPPSVPVPGISDAGGRIASTVPTVPAALNSEGRPGNASPLTITTVGCGVLKDAEPQALGLTYWFDAPANAVAAALTIRFTGRRLGIQGLAGASDTFVTDATIDPVLPTGGRIAVTARVLDVAPGQWQVSATPLTTAKEWPGPQPPTVSRRGGTAFAPVVRVRAPGVRLGIWPLMVLLGTMVALVVESTLAQAHGLPVPRLLAITFLACLSGVVGAKIYYLATHRGEKLRLLTVGMSLQGFVLASIGTLMFGALATDLPVGATLDVATPGLLFGAAVGRLGCFYGGCCAGRPTASGWGLWSSNRSLGVRRIPVQLMDSAVAVILGLIALGLVMAHDAPATGLVFVGTLAAYTLARQLLFPLRDLPRKTPHGRHVTLVVTTAVVLGVIAIATFA